MTSILRLALVYLGTAGSTLVSQSAAAQVHKDSVYDRFQDRVTITLSTAELPTTNPKVTVRFIYTLTPPCDNLATGSRRFIDCTRDWMRFIYKSQTRDRASQYFAMTCIWSIIDGERDKWCGSQDSDSGPRKSGGYVAYQSLWLPTGRYDTFLGASKAEFRIADVEFALTPALRRGAAEWHKARLEYDRRYKDSVR